MEGGIAETTNTAETTTTAMDAAAVETTPTEGAIDMPSVSTEELALEIEIEATKTTLSTFFRAINTNDVHLALDCCAESVSVTYPDPGRNWIGKERGRVVMTAIFGQLSRIKKQATYELVEILRRKEEGSTEHVVQIKTKETWGHDHIISKTTYTFDSNHNILSMES